jgi:hypothetical protein
LLCIEISAALRHFRVDILIQICVERNERVIALDPDPRGVQCRPILAISGLDPLLLVVNVGSPASNSAFRPLAALACVRAIRRRPRPLD